MMRSAGTETGATPTPPASSATPGTSGATDGTAALAVAPDLTRIDTDQE